MLFMCAVYGVLGRKYFTHYNEKEQLMDVGKEVDKYNQKLSIMQKMIEDFHKKGALSFADLLWDATKQRLTGKTTEAQKNADDANFILEDMPKSFRDDFAKAELNRDPQEMERLLNYAKDNLILQKKSHLGKYNAYRNGIAPEKS